MLSKLHFVTSQPPSYCLMPFSCCSYFCFAWFLLSSRLRNLYGDSSPRFAYYVFQLMISLVLMCNWERFSFPSNVFCLHRTGAPQEIPFFCLFVFLSLFTSALKGSSICVGLEPIHLWNVDLGAASLAHD